MRLFLAASAVCASLFWSSTAFSFEIEYRLESYLEKHLFYNVSGNEADISLSQCQLTIVRTGRAVCGSGSKEYGDTVITDSISLKELRGEIAIRPAPSTVPATSLTFRFERWTDPTSTTVTRLCDAKSVQRYSPYLAYVLLLDGSDHRAFSRDLEMYISSTCKG